MATLTDAVCVYVQGLIPDFILRLVIRALCRQRLRSIDRGSFEANHASKMEWIDDVRSHTIAECTRTANEQHYEVSDSALLLVFSP